MALVATAVTLSSGRSRSSQSFILTNAIPASCPLPEKLVPDIVMTDSTASCSFSEKWLRTFSMTFLVCSNVALGGSRACTNRIPWSSSGR